MSTEPKCPFHQTAGGGTTNRDWWPGSLRLDLLHQHSSKSDPMGADFDYAEAFRSLDLAAASETEGFEAHRFEGEIARQNHQIGPGNLAAVLLLQRPQQAARFVEVCVIGPTV